jgi:hypothetical protein
MTVTFARAIDTLTRQMKHQSVPVYPAKWQSIDVSKRPEAEMRELRNVMFTAEMLVENLAYYQAAIKPNLPWADRHFILERVSGQPINPGSTWKEWPGGNSAANFLEPGGVFSHTYAERYWPKLVNYNAASELDCYPMAGLRYAYGDLGDVIKLLASDPLTRQAYLPVWFPEDTGVVHGKRVPCTLGYHWMMRDNKLHVFYPIRSCDFALHFRDDLYLTVRLTMWLLQQLRQADHKFWNDVDLGEFQFWAGSLHCFINHWRKL